MNVDTAVIQWSKFEMLKTLELMNEILEAEGKGSHTLSSDPTVSFLIAEPMKCPDGHTWENCFAATPPRPVMQITAKTDQGQTMMKEMHLGELNLPELVKAVAHVADGTLTLN